MKSETFNKINCDGIVKHYNSISFNEILKKIIEFDGVEICKYQEITEFPIFPTEIFKSPLSSFIRQEGRMISFDGNSFEYPIWYNEEFGEGSENCKNIIYNKIDVTPRLFPKIFEALRGKTIEDIVGCYKSKLTKFMDAMPISEDNTSMLYFEKIEERGDCHLVKATQVSVMKKNLKKIWFDRYSPEGELRERYD